MKGGDVGGEMRTLGHFSGVRCVGSVPSGVLQHVALDDTRNKRPVIPKQQHASQPDVYVHAYTLTETHAYTCTRRNVSPRPASLSPLSMSSPFSRYIPFLYLPCADVRSERERRQKVVWFFRFVFAFSVYVSSSACKLVRTYMRTLTSSNVYICSFMHVYTGHERVSFGCTEEKYVFGV